MPKKTALTRTTATTPTTEPKPATKIRMTIVDIAIEDGDQAGADAAARLMMTALLAAFGGAE